VAARIALIDSGVHAAHAHVRGQGKVELGPTIVAGRAREMRATQLDSLGHGTCAAAAILDLAPGSTLYSIQVFEHELTCPFEHILEALRCAFEWDCELINLSLGTIDTRWKPDLKDIAREARVRGVQIVSPATYAGLPSYPGFLDGFVGVLMDAMLPRDKPQLRKSGKREVWFASPYPRDLPDLPRASNLAGPSLAAANLTGFLARSR
jgi:hypothetical protein